VSPTIALPDLASIVQRLEAQLDAAPGTGRLTREDILVLAVLAIERDATMHWTDHRPECGMFAKKGWERHCTCGLEEALSRSFLLRRRLAPPEPPRDLRHRRKGDGR
jgi:hypothetical protein